MSYMPSRRVRLYFFQEDEMKKFLLLLMACIFVLASVSAFAEIDPDATITIALTTIHENMDYMISSSLNAASVFHSMYDELIGMN